MSDATPPTQVLPPSILAAEARTRDYLRRREWRKARDEIKPLIRIARDRFVPLLIEANLGLAREMHERGQAGGVKQVFDYLATIAPPEVLESLRREFSRPAKDDPGYAASLRQSLFSEGTSLAEPQRIQLVDALVVRFEDLSGDPAVPPAFLADLVAVYRSMELLGGNRIAEADDAVRPISHRSLLRHWVVLMRGLTAFHLGHDDRARRLLSSLPVDSVPARAAEAYLFLLTPAGEDRGVPSDYARHGVGVLTREPEIARVIHQADGKWRSGDHFGSYELVRNKIPGFPSLKPGWPSALADFYFRAHGRLPHEAQDDYLSGLGTILSRGTQHSPTEEMHLLRVLVTQNVASAPPKGLARDWLRFLHLRKELVGADPRFESIACHWLGDKLAHPPPPRLLFGLIPQHRSTARDEELAIRLLTRAIETSPSHLEAHLSLAGLLRRLGKKADLNRLLDEMTRSFPESKAVLIEAGLGCIEREAFVKGLEYLRRAREIDTIDPLIARHLVAVQIRFAHHNFKRHQLDRARRCFEEIDSLLTGDVHDFQIGRWAVGIQRFVLEQEFGEQPVPPPDPEPGDTGPFPAARLFAIELFRRKLFDPKASRSPSFPKTKAALAETPTAARALFLLRLFRHVAGDSREPGYRPEAGLLGGYLGRLAKLPCTRAEALQLIELGSVDFQKNTKGFIGPVLRRDPADPRFRWLKLEARLLHRYGPPSDYELREARSILDEARQRGDTETVQRVESRFRHIHRQVLPIGGAFEDAFDDDDDDDPIDFEPPGGPLPVSPGQPPPGLAHILEALANATPETIDELRRTLPKDIPAEMLEMLIANAGKQSPVPPDRPPPPPRPRPRPRPPMDPMQQELF